MQTNTNPKPKKPSWLYHEIARRIQTPKKKNAVRIMLNFLGDVSNDSGRSYYGHKKIQKYTGLCEKSQTRACNFLKDEYKILDWTRGFGGRNVAVTNTYQFNLSAMKALLKSQGGFDPETLQEVNSPRTPDRMPVDITKRSTDISSRTTDISSRTTDISSKNTRQDASLTPNTTTPNENITPKISNQGAAPVFEKTFLNESAIQQTQDKTHDSEPIGAAETPVRMPVVPEAQPTAEPQPPDPGDWPDPAPGKWRVKMQGRTFADWDSAYYCDRQERFIQPGQHWVLMVSPTGERTKTLNEFTRREGRWVAPQVQMQAREAV